MGGGPRKHLEMQTRKEQQHVADKVRAYVDALSSGLVCCFFSVHFFWFGFLFFF